MSDRSSRLRTLLLAQVYSHQDSDYDNWSDAFRRSRDFACTYADTLDYLAPIVPTLSARKTARLLTFVGNEFNSPHAPLFDKINMIRAM